MLLQLQAGLYSPSDRVMYGINFSAFFFSWAFRGYKKSCHTFQFSEVNRAGNQTSLEVHIQLTWSLSVCLPWVRRDKRREQTGFVAKTIEVMARLASRHRGAPGKCTRLFERGILCAVFRSVPSLPLCKAVHRAVFHNTALFMNSADLHIQPSISQSRMSGDHQPVCLHLSQLLLWQTLYMF